MTEWIPADEIPRRVIPGRRTWKDKFKEFMNSRHTIAFLQFENIKETLSCAEGFRRERKRAGLTGDNVRITSNKAQLRVYVAKRLDKMS